jgi:hypothetical protein
LLEALSGIITIIVIFGKEWLLRAMPAQAGIDSPRKLFLLRENTSNLVTAVRTGALVEEIRDCVHQIDLSHQDRNEKSLGRILNSQV